MFVRTDRQFFYKHITAQKCNKDDSAFTIKSRTDERNRTPSFLREILFATAVCNKRSAEKLKMPQNPAYGKTSLQLWLRGKSLIELCEIEHPTD